MLHQFAYISNQTVNFSDDDLKFLMKYAREKNKRLELTGLLLYDKGTFLQILEGPEESIDSMISDISSDSRHENMDIVFRNDKLYEREFANWRMGLQILGSYNNNDYAQLDNRIKDLLNKAKPSGRETHELLTNYTRLKNSYINLNDIV